MVHPPAQPRKRRAVQQAPPAGAAKAEARSGDRNVPANKRARAAEPSPLIHHDEVDEFSRDFCVLVSSG
jgi:hypothetical protein